MRWMLALLAVLAAPPALGAPPSPSTSFSFSSSAAAAPQAVVDLQGSYDAGEVSFTLEASQVHVETDTAGWVVSPAAAVGTTPPATTSRDDGRSRWTGVSSGGVTGLFVHGGGTLVLSALEGTVEAATGECRTQPMYFARDRQPACPSLEGAVHLQAAPAGAWVLTGDFAMALWSWHGQVERDGAVEEFRTGTVDNGPSLAHTGQMEMRHTLLWVREGRLELGLVPRVAVDVFAPQVHFAAGAVDLGAGPTVLVGDGLEVGRDPAGKLSASVAAPAAVETPFEGSPRTLVLALALLLAAGMACVLALRHRAGVRHLEHALANLRMGNLNAAARHADRARRWPALRPSAGALGAIAMLRAGELDAAEDFLAARRRPADASTLYLQAHLHSLAGRVESAQAALDACLRRDATYVREAARNPALAHLLDPSAWPGGTP